MFAITTDQGTAAAETALCADCYHQGTRYFSNDEDVAGRDYVDCGDDNDMLVCLECGATIPDLSRVDDRGVREVLDITGYTQAVGGSDVVTCGACGRSWDNAVTTGVTPTPAARCPFEYEHDA